MASVVCVSIKICVSSISLYKLNPDKLTTPFELAHQFTLLCIHSDFKLFLVVTKIHARNHSFVLTNSYLTLYRAVVSLPGHSLPLLFTDLCLLQLWSDIFSPFGNWSPSLTAALEFECECFLPSRHHSKFSWTHAQQVCFTYAQCIRKITCYTMWSLSILRSRHRLDSFNYLLSVWLFSTLLLSSKGKFHVDG